MSLSISSDIPFCTLMFKSSIPSNNQQHIISLFFLINSSREVFSNHSNPPIYFFILGQSDDFINGAYQGKPVPPTSHQRCFSLPLNPPITLYLANRKPLKSIVQNEWLNNQTVLIKQLMLCNGFPK